MVGEIHVVDDELLANSRRDGFEKNNAYYELVEILKLWAINISKYIRNKSYARNLSAAKRKIVEADAVDDLNNLDIADFSLD